jgi:Flp pilus assembly pilin Flp
VVVVKRFVGSHRDETGQDLIEYGLLAAFISIVSLATVKLNGPLVNALWVIVRDAIAG